MVSGCNAYGYISSSAKKSKRHQDKGGNELNKTPACLLWKCGCGGHPLYIFTKGVIGTQASALIMVAPHAAVFFWQCMKKTGSPQRRFCILCYGRKSSRRESVPINQKIFTDSWRRKRE